MNILLAFIYDDEVVEQYQLSLYSKADNFLVIMIQY